MTHLGQTWDCLTANNVSTPGTANWREYVTTGYPAWLQPTGAGDAYPVGFRVTHLGQNWQNTSPANTNAPGVFGWVTMMISLFGTTDVLRIVTSSTANIDVVGTYVTNSEPVAFGAIWQAIASATTTTLAAAPGDSLKRDVISLTIRNRHASAANTVTLQIFDGVTAWEIVKFTPSEKSAGLPESAGSYSPSQKLSRLEFRCSAVIPPLAVRPGSEAGETASPRPPDVRRKRTDSNR